VWLSFALDVRTNRGDLYGWVRVVWCGALRYCVVWFSGVCGARLDRCDGVVYMARYG